MNMIMKPPIVLYWSVLLCLSSTACSRLNTSGISVQGAPGNTAMPSSPSQASPENIVEIESSLAKGTSLTWKVEAAKVSGREALDHIRFLDDIHGWAAGEDAIYKTADGGKVWERVKIDLPEKAHVADVFFVNPSLGWVAIQKEAFVLNYQEDQTWLLKSSDGGQTWRQQHEDNESVAARIGFVNEQEGWVIGSKYIGLAPLRFRMLILHTLDQGQHWVDVSQGLNRIAADSRGIVNSNLIDILPVGPLTAMLLTTRGKIYKTENGGQNWQQTRYVGDDLHRLLPAATLRLGIKEDQHLWVAGGAYNTKGTWATLAVEQNGSWIRYGLDGFYFEDILFLSEQQVLACGSIPYHGYAVDFRDRGQGVILASSDSGHSWSIIYRNPQVKSIKALAATDSQHIWAVGEDGLILHLESTSETASRTASQ